MRRLPLLLALAAAFSGLAGCSSSRTTEGTTAATTAASQGAPYFPAVPKRASTPEARAASAKAVRALDSLCRARDDGLARLLAEPLPQSEAALRSLYLSTGLAYARESAALRAAAGSGARQFADYLAARAEVSRLLASVAETHDRVLLHVRIGELEQRAQSARALAREAGLKHCARR